MPKESPERKLNLSNVKLSGAQIATILKENPGVKLDEGKQHFVVEHSDENGKWTHTDFLPTWKTITYEDGTEISIEEELKKILPKKTAN